MVKQQIVLKNEGKVTKLKYAAYVRGNDSNCFKLKSTVVMLYTPCRFLCLLFFFYHFIRNFMLDDKVTAGDNF